MGNLTLKGSEFTQWKGVPSRGRRRKEAAKNERPQSNSNDSKQQTTQVLSSIQ